MLGNWFSYRLIRSWFDWLIDQVAEGIFDVVAVFNATNEYVLYYHSGKKTIRLTGACNNNQTVKLKCRLCIVFT